MAARSTARSKNRDSDSQLEFFKLTFQGLQTAESPKATAESPQTEPTSLEVAEPESTSAPAASEEIHLPPLENLPAEEVPLRNQNNYRISDADRLGVGSLKAKCKANLEAIELLKIAESQSFPAEHAAKQTLIRYVGWGGLPQVFDSLNESWKEEREKLEKLLTPEELESARATTLNAHYTAPVVITAMYATLQRLGFEHGRILEPACGVGHFIGLMPGEMHSRSQITGIEIDSITARLAKVLYPDADIRHQPFEESKLADGFYDVAISNIPFGNYKPYDPRFKSWNFLIHDYFFAAALEKVRPGGLILFITSRGTFDKGRSSSRIRLAESGFDCSHPAAQ